jgi:hypothetical protein
MGLSHRSWIGLSSVVTMSAVATLGAVLLRRNPQPAPPRHMLPSASADPSEAPPPSEDPNVLVHIESTPAGAAIVHVSNHAVLGYTPETVQFRRSAGPITIRLELKGFAPETRDVSTAADGNLDIILQAGTQGTRPRPGG